MAEHDRTERPQREMHSKRKLGLLLNSSLETALATIIEAAERRDAAGVTEVLRRFPQFESELRECLENYRWIDPDAIALKVDLCGQVLGDFELLDEIDRGGMGTVYRAQQRSLDRIVALKVMQGGSLASEEFRKRFRIEAESAATLSHPGIVPIFEIGHCQGHDYFSMPLVDGMTLRQAIDRNRHASRSDDRRGAAEAADANATPGRLPATIDPGLTVAIGMRIADAVDHAHRHGIVHRDLKPSNVILRGAAQDSDLARCHPMILDFGLARHQDGGSGVTQTGQVVGTLHFMAPEQAGGQVTADPRVDIYAIGATLYAMLTGRPPHGDWDANPAAVMMRLINEQPPSIASVVEGCPVGLSHVIRQAMHRTPSMRYQTAAELADDLRRLSRGESVVAGDHSIVRRVVEEIDADRHGNVFRSWSHLLWQFGVIIFVAHVAIFVLGQMGLAELWAYWMPRMVMLVAIAARILWVGGWRWFPRSIADRPVWSIWIGYLTALAAINALSLSGHMDRGSLFPLTSILSCFGFVAMSGHVWGFSGILGLGFLVVAALCVGFPAAASLFFGSMWMLALGVLSYHYRYRAGGPSHLGAYNDPG